MDDRAHSKDQKPNAKDGESKAPRVASLVAGGLLVGIAVLGASCAETPPDTIGVDTGSSESIGESEDALTCLTLVRGGTYAVEDAHIVTDPADPSRANTNYGAATALNTGTVGSGFRRGLIRFDLSAIPAGSVVTSMRSRRARIAGSAIAWSVPSGMPACPLINAAATH